jgi:hypothetical protein
MDGWRGGESGRPSAILGPCFAGKPALFVAVADVVRRTEDWRAPQRYEEMVTEQRRKADEEECRRNYEASERGRLEKIENELAAINRHNPIEPPWY